VSHSRFLPDALVEEYQAKYRWRYSSMEDAIQFARLNEVKQLLLTHHDPMHSDEQLRLIQNQLKEKFKGTVNVDWQLKALRLNYSLIKKISINSRRGETF